MQINSSSAIDKFVLSEFKTYLVVIAHRHLFCYDYVRNKFLFKILISVIEKCFFLDYDNVLVLQESDSLMLYNIQSLILS